MAKETAAITQRRSFLRQAATIVGGSAFLSSSGFIHPFAAVAQNPPSGCPIPPSGGTPFAPGQDKRPITLRKSINSFSTAELTQLRNAFAALRALPANDPRTWVLQADIHALYCQQCSNDNTQIHYSWNFFPWHRAYLYYYERILGSLVSNLNGFRLPYWDWENIRTLPAAYTTPGNNTNPLWDQKRNSGLAGGGNLPVNDGTQGRLNTLDAITDFATFGGTASGSGGWEYDPHGVIHNDVGTPSPVYQDMGDLGYAARDPIFFAHHCNIDKLWSRWNAQASAAMPGAFTNPTTAVFLNTRWSFYDENKNVVSISSGDVLDHQNNLRYTYQPYRLQIPPFKLIYECKLICCGPGPDPGPFLEVTVQVRESLLAAARSKSGIALVLQGVTVPAGVSGNFDIVAVRADRKMQLGSFGIIHESHMMQKTGAATVILDATNAISDLIAEKEPASLHVVPRQGEKGFTLQAKSAQFRVQAKAQ